MTFPGGLVPAAPSWPSARSPGPTHQATRPLATAPSSSAALQAKPTCSCQFFVCLRPPSGATGQQVADRDRPALVSVLDRGTAVSHRADTVDVRLPTPWLSLAERHRMSQQATTPGGEAMPLVRAAAGWGAGSPGWYLSAAVRVRLLISPMSRRLVRRSWSAAPTGSPRLAPSVQQGPGPRCRPALKAAAPRMCP